MAEDAVRAGLNEFVVGTEGGFVTPLLAEMAGGGPG